MIQNSIIFIHRGRNPNVDYLGSLFTKKDFIFDYRGKNSLILLLKSFFISLKIPDADFYLRSEREKNKQVCFSERTNKYMADTIYLVEGGLCFWPIFFKKIFHRKIKIILIAPEPIFNYRTRSMFKNFLLKKIFQSINYILPISQLVAQDSRFYIKKPYSLLNCVFLKKNDQQSFLINKPDFDKKNLLFIINRPKETGWTKGLDVVLKIFDLLLKIDKEWHLYIIGAGTEDCFTENRSPNIHLEGYQDPKKYFPFCPFILSPSRYDAFNMGILQACLAGLIPIVSLTTGVEEFISEIDKNLIIDYKKPEKYVEQILFLYKLSQEKKKELVDNLKEKAVIYNEEKFNLELNQAIKNMESVFKIKFNFKNGEPFSGNIYG